MSTKKKILLSLALFLLVYIPTGQMYASWLEYAMIHKRSATARILLPYPTFECNLQSSDSFETFVDAFTYDCFAFKHHTLFKERNNEIDLANLANQQKMLEVYPIREKAPAQYWSLVIFYLPLFLCFQLVFPLFAWIVWLVIWFLHIIFIMIACIIIVVVAWITGQFLGPLMPN